MTNIAELVFNGMRAGDRSKTQLTKNDLRTWTKQIMAKKHPDKEFSEEMFERGFRVMDVNKDGRLDLDDIRLMVLKKVQKENLYVGK